MSKEKLFLIIIGAIVFIAVAIMVGPNLFRYSRAMRLKENGEYSEARRIFDDLDHYRDSREQFYETRYLEAMSKREQGEYEYSRKAFWDLATIDYEDSVEQVEESTYEHVISLMDSGEYTEAADLIKQVNSSLEYSFGIKLTDYKDIELLRNKCWYTYGLELESDYEIDAAIECYRKCDGGYEDSYDRIIDYTVNKINNSQIGDIIPIGESNWLVVTKEDGKALVLLYKKRIEEIAYNETLTSVGWIDSSIRMVINHSCGIDSERYNFTPEEKELILPVKVVDNLNYDFDVDPADEETDRFFLLSREEIENYFPDISVLRDKKSDFYESWWLRGCESEEEKAVISPNGAARFFHYDVDYSTPDARPAMWVSCNTD